ncbi:hypothetical protein ACJX0J_016508 [Zea mays]
MIASDMMIMVFIFPGLFICCLILFIAKGTWDDFHFLIRYIDGFTLSPVAPAKESPILELSLHFFWQSLIAFLALLNLGISLFAGVLEYHYELLYQEIELLNINRKHFVERNSIV